MSNALARPVQGVSPVAEPASGKSPVSLRRDSGAVAITRPVAALGPLSPRERDLVKHVTSDLSAPLLSGSLDDVPEASNLAPIAFLVAMGSSAAQRACVQVRLRRAFAHVPILGIASELGDLHFSEMFAMGGDDVISVDAPDRLRARIRRLARSASESPLPHGRKGVAVVLGGDPSWRAVMGRVLANGGYEVSFAVEPSSAARPDAKLVVSDESLFRAGGADVVCARPIEALTPWVVMAAPRRLAALRRELEGAARVTVGDAFAPPENVLFLANELGFDVASRRASPRLLFGTSIAFRAAGRDKDELGFSYNLSATGLYVRTLAPVDPGEEVWLEMWPPRSDRRVRLVGRVVWRRAFGQSETATVPPGFGVQLEGGLGGDLERYRQAYDVLGQSSE